MLKFKSSLETFLEKDYLDKDISIISLKLASEI